MMKAVSHAKSLTLASSTNSHAGKAQSGLARSDRKQPFVKPGRELPQRRIKAKVSSTATTSLETETMEVELKIEGMVCAHCSSRVHDALLGLDNVKDAAVSHETGIANLKVDAENCFDAWNQLPHIVDTLTSLGFEAEPYFSEEM